MHSPRERSRNELETENAHLRASLREMNRQSAPVFDIDHRSTLTWKQWFGIAGIVATAAISWTIIKLEVSKNTSDIIELKVDVKDVRNVQTDQNRALDRIENRLGTK